MYGCRDNKCDRRWPWATLCHRRRRHVAAMAMSAEDFTVRFLPRRLVAQPKDVVVHAWSWRPWRRFLRNLA
jgi:hypothetical protein